MNFLNADLPVRSLGGILTSSSSEISLAFSYLASSCPSPSTGSSCTAASSSPSKLKVN